jgi:hypothetical protein
MQARSLFADGPLGLQLAHRTIERRGIHAHFAADLANGHAGLSGHAFEHLLAALSRLGKHAARRVIGYLDAKALRKLAQLTVLLDQWLELPDPRCKISFKPAKVAEDR